MKEASGKVFVRPAYTLTAVLMTVLSIGTALWLANLQLIGTVFESSQIPFWQKFSFLFELYQVIFRVTPVLQLFLLAAFALMSGFSIGLWLYVFLRQHNNKPPYEHAGYALAVGLVGGSLSVLGASLTMPVVTVYGLALGIDSYVLGSLALLAGLTIQTSAIRQLSLIIASDKS